MRSRLSSSFLVRSDVSGSSGGRRRGGLGTKKNEINIVVPRPLHRRALEKTKKAVDGETQNQCGSCLSWRLAHLTDLGRGARIYLCDVCTNPPEAA